MKNSNNQKEKNNETRIIDIQKLNRLKTQDGNMDVTELVLLSGYAGLVIIWVFACCS